MSAKVLKQDYLSQVAISTGLPGEAAVPVSPANPLPIASAPSQAAAESDPLTGDAVVTIVAGPFVPELGRPINLTLSGNWSGTVAVQRSTDGGDTKQGLTVGGSPWAVFTANCNEPVWTETEAGATFYLAITRQSGTIGYRVAQ